MYEIGFDDKLPDPERALENYKYAHNKGNSDASINLAIYYLNGRFIKPDANTGKALLIYAYKDRNPRCVDCMLTYGLIKNKSEIDGLIQSNTLMENTRDLKRQVTLDYGRHNNSRPQSSQMINISEIVPSYREVGEPNINTVLHQAGLLKMRTSNELKVENSDILVRNDKQIS
jgi:hypothetical protein